MVNEPDPDDWSVSPVKRGEEGEGFSHYDEEGIPVYIPSPALLAALDQTQAGACVMYRLRQCEGQTTDRMKGSLRMNLCDHHAEELL